MSLPIAKVFIEFAIDVAEDIGVKDMEWHMRRATLEKWGVQLKFVEFNAEDDVHEYPDVGGRRTILGHGVAYVYGETTEEELEDTFIDMFQDAIGDPRGSLLYGDKDVYVKVLEGSLAEDARNPKKRRKRKRPDPKRSRAAKKAAKNPKTKQKKKKAAKKFAKSAEGKAFHKKLGRFNSRRSLTKSERTLNWAVLALNDYIAAGPPDDLLSEAKSILGECGNGIVSAPEIIVRVEKLALATEAIFREDD